MNILLGCCSYSILRSPQGTKQDGDDRRCDEWKPQKATGPGRQACISFACHGPNTSRLLSSGESQCPRPVMRQGGQQMQPCGTSSHVVVLADGRPGPDQGEKKRHHVWLEPVALRFAASPLPCLWPCGCGGDGPPATEPAGLALDGCC